MNRTYETTKRVFDFVVVAAGLAVLSPFMLVFYLLVRSTSEGRGFYIQDRAGKDGAVFRMIKFRTMRADHKHDPDPTVVIASGHEAVTPVGRFLRKFKLDELPQLFNVFAGHMSLVGPRPTVPEQVAEYGEFERRRLLARPGITGLAQVNGGTGLTWPERIEWDVYYVERRCWSMDIKILLRTALALIVGTEKNVRRFRP
ncbi:MAG: sugar transferase [Phycisphaerae bacterium]|nr:sugar transferase [Phycisphaerae bacterium]